ELLHHIVKKDPEHARIKFLLHRFRFLDSGYVSEIELQSALNITIEGRRGYALEIHAAFIQRGKRTEDFLIFRDRHRRQTSGLDRIVQNMFSDIQSRLKQQLLQIPAHFPLTEYVSFGIVEQVNI